MKLYEIINPTTVRAALLVAGVSFEEATAAYDLEIGYFMADGMRESACGIYYTTGDDLSGDETRSFISFDGDVEGWRHIAPEGAIQHDWGFRDLR